MAGLYAVVDEVPVVEGYIKILINVVIVTVEDCDDDVQMTANAAR